MNSNQREKWGILGTPFKKNMVDLVGDRRLVMQLAGLKNLSMEEQERNFISLALF